MEIFCNPKNNRLWKSRIVAEFNGVKLPEGETAIKIAEKENRTEAFLHLNPFGQIPTLKLDGDQGIFESNSIARYVARLGEAPGRQGKKDLYLYGRNIAEASRIDAFLDAVYQLGVNLDPWMARVQKFAPTMQFTRQDIEQKKAGTKKSMAGF